MMPAASMSARGMWGMAAPLSGPRGSALPRTRVAALRPSPFPLQLRVPARPMRSEAARKLRMAAPKCGNVRAAMGGEASPTAAEGAKKVNVLFVCWGNICRSPTAEAVFRSVVQKQGLQDSFVIDSAGTINDHEGEPSDARMRAAASKRGINITSISRPITPQDFTDFDIILAMDQKNNRDIRRAYEVWSKRMTLPPNALDKVKMMCSYSKRFDVEEVPDPYYGGPQGFELVLDLLDDACTELLETLKPKVKA